MRYGWNIDFSLLDNGIADTTYEVSITAIVKANPSITSTGIFNFILKNPCRDPEYIEIIF